MLSRIMLLCAVLFFCALLCFAQEHNTNCSKCRFYKKGPEVGTSAKTSSECGCQACSKITQEEEKTKKLAQEKIDKANAEKVAAQNKANAEQSIKENKEALEKNKSTNVVINNTSNTSTWTPPAGTQTLATKIMSKKDNTKSKLFSKQICDNGTCYTLFFNEAGDTIMSSTEYKHSYNQWAKGIDTPANIILVDLYDPTKQFPGMTLINSKGERLLGEQAYYIQYGKDNFFICMACDDGGRNCFDMNSYSMLYADKVIIYDVVTKQKHYFNKKADNTQCKINNRVQIYTTLKEDNNGNDGLFHFYYCECTHNEVNSGYNQANFYKISFDEKRQLLTERPIITQKDFWKH